jgi:hypothetical protein
MSRNHDIRSIFIILLILRVASAYNWFHYADRIDLNYQQVNAYALYLFKEAYLLQLNNKGYSY